MVTKKQNFKEAQKIVSYLVESYNLKENLIAIYAMGSFVEGIISKGSDIDLNIFLKKTGFKELKELKKALKITESRFGRKIDNNIISEKEIKGGIIDSRVFPHKYRHALLIYELKHYNWLLYGEDILRNIKINYSELYEETIKLLLTLGYRFRKIYLAGGTLQESKKQSIKFVIYACKFALINKGIYVYDNSEVENRFMNEFFYLKDISVVSECFRAMRDPNREISSRLMERAVNFVEELSEERLDEFKRKNGYTN